MTDLEKLELVHCAIQEVIKLDLPSGLDEEMDNALELIEQLLEPYLVSRHCKNSLTEVREEPELRNPMGELI